MAIGVYVQNEGFTLDKYNEALKKLEAAGAGAPQGRTYHFAFGDENHVLVFDIWESQEAFEKFGETLVPVLGELGITLAQPMVSPIFNTIVGN